MGGRRIVLVVRRGGHRRTGTARRRACGVAPRNARDLSDLTECHALIGLRRLRVLGRFFHGSDDGGRAVISTFHDGARRRSRNGGLRLLWRIVVDVVGR